jgi:hypothetical protein
MHRADMQQASDHQHDHRALDIEDARATVEDASNTGLVSATELLIARSTSADAVGCAARRSARASASTLPRALRPLRIGERHCGLRGEHRQQVAVGLAKRPNAPSRSA